MQSQHEKLLDKITKRGEEFAKKTWRQPRNTGSIITSGEAQKIFRQTQRKQWKKLDLQQGRTDCRPTHIDSPTESNPEHGGCVKYTSKIQSTSYWNASN